MKSPFDKGFEGVGGDSRAAKNNQCALTEEKKHTGIKAKYIVLAVLALVVVAAGFFVYANRDNIAAVYTLYVTRKTGGDMQTLQEQNDKRIQRILDSLTQTKIRDLTDEEVEMFQNGELTEDEAIELITGNAATVDEAKKIVKERKEAAAASNTAKKDAIIAQIYVLRASYSGQLDALVSGAIREYMALPESKRGAGTKAGMIDSLIARGSALEGQCDAQMEGLLASLQSELQRLGESTGVISDIRAAYVQEKRLKKAAMLNSYY